MIAKKKKKAVFLRADEDDLIAVELLVSDYRNLSVNEVASLALGELAKVERKPGALWEALGRIAGANGVTPGQTPPPATPRPQNTRSRIQDATTAAA